MPDLNVKSQASLNLIYHGTILLFYCLPLNLRNRGWSWSDDGVRQLPVLEHPTNLYNIRTGAYCACSRCSVGLLGCFFCHLLYLYIRARLFKASLTGQLVKCFTTL